MLKFQKWTWTGYFLVYALITSGNTSYFFQRDSLINMYYTALIAYDPLFLVSPLLNLISIVLNALSLIPLYLYIKDTCWLSPVVWRVFFAARLAFDLTGRSYELQILKSLYYHDLILVIKMLFPILIFIIPSYAAHFRYAFRGQSPV